MVYANEPGLPRTDMFGSEFGVGAPTSEEEAERKKSRTKRAQRVPSRLFLRISSSLQYFVGFFKALANFSSISQLMPNLFQKFPEAMACRLLWRLMVS